MISFLTPEQILFIHNLVVRKTSGTHGVRDLSMLLSALGRPQASFDGKDLYEDLFLKAGALLDSLIRNHPFVDGNKRIAIVSTALFLQKNGYSIIVENEEMVRFTVDCAQSKVSVEEMSEWLELFSKHISKTGQ